MSEPPEIPAHGESIGVEIKSLRDQLTVSSGWGIMVDLAGVRRSRNVLQSNWFELDTLIGPFKFDVQVALDVFANPVDPMRWERFLNGLDAPLHNYVAAVKSLVDHQRIVSETYLAGENRDRYQDEVKRRFINSPGSQFVQQLRDYLLHVRLPVTAGSFSFARGTDGPEHGSVAHSITLDVPSMMKWKKWNLRSREYFKRSGDNLDLHEALAIYYADADDFHNWFDRHIRECNLDAINEAQDLIDAHNALVERLTGELVVLKSDPSIDQGVGPF